MKLKNSKEKGAMLPLLAVGAFAIVAVAGLAIDASHAFVNVTRVQNALDAAALSAATALHNNDKNVSVATTRGAQTFAEHLEGELANGVSVSFEFSDTLSPWNGGASDANFVRAVADNHTIAMFFARILPGVGDDLTIGSTAVSGPIPILGGQVCDLAPLLVCGDPALPNAGLTVGEAQCLKFAGGTNTGNGNGGGGNGNGGGGNVPVECAAQLPDDPDGVGPGNYHLLDLGNDDASGNDIRFELAGRSQACSTTSGTFTLDTAPGNKVGPVTQGFNTRFGQYQGPVSPAEFPPDLVTTPGTYAEYLTAYSNQAFTNPEGQEGRRIMALPIGNCAGIQNGVSTLPIFDIKCYFMREPTTQSGQDNYILGELIDDCNISGTPGATTPALGGPFIIVLFNDPDNPAT